MKRLLSNATKWDGFWWIAGVVAVLAIGCLFSWVYWEDLRGENESLSTTIRNLGLIIGGVIAIILAVWRSRVAERQVAAAEGSLLNERYQKGAEMLGSPVLSVRLGGIYALSRLAEEHPEQYHIQILNLLCAFARNPTKDEKVYMEEKLREDVQAVLTYVGRRGSSGLRIEREGDFKLDLHGANLSFARLSGANLAGGDLSNALLSHANFFDRTPLGPDLSTPIPSGPNQPQAAIGIPGSSIPLDFSGVESRRANLSGSMLSGADLSDTFLLGADLSGAQLVRANLSRSQLIKANLYKAVLLGADLSGAFFLGACLSGAQLASGTLVGTMFPEAKLYGANFFMASLDGADFSGAVLSKDNGKYVATGLTQVQLDKVRVNPSNPPDLTGVVGAASGVPLVWSGKSLDDQG